MNDDPREIQRGVFKRALLMYPKWNTLGEQAKIDIVRRLERSCYNMVVIECQEKFIPARWEEPIFLKRYAAECYRILSNIANTTSNGELANKLISGDIDPNDISKMSSYDLCPTATQQERDEINARMNARVDKKYSNDACRKCGEKKVLRIGVQTRAADELASFHYKCDSCGNTWGT